MIIIHAAQLDGSLTLWGEDSDRPPRSRRPAGINHPRSASASRLAEAVGIAPTNHAHVKAEATVWLPSRGNNPIPSEPLAGPAPKSRAKPRIKPWRVPILRVSNGQAIELLQRCQGVRVLAPGIVLNHDVAYWQHVLMFAVSLTARQQFLPNVTQNHENTKAVWTPLYIGDDAIRLAELAKGMPHSARALTSADHRQPTTPAQAALKEFIASIVNHIIRQDATEGSAQFDSVHELWLQALISSDGVVHANAAQLQQLRRQVAEWHRPIAVAANSPYRLCLRLEEPPEPDEDEPLAALHQQDWYLRYLLQPHDDHSLLLPLETAQERQSPDFNPAEFLLTSLAQAGSVCPPIADSLNKPKPAGATLGAEQAHHFLTQQAAALQQAGFGVMLPSWWTRRGTKNRPSIRAEVRTPPMQGGANMTMASLIDLNVQVAMGDEVIEPEELLELADLKVPLVRFRGQWVEINADEIRAAADFWRDRSQTTLREVIRIGLGADQQAEADNVSLSATGWLNGLLESLQ